MSFLSIFVATFSVAFIFNWLILLPVDGTGSNQYLPPDSARKTSGLGIISLGNINTMDPVDKWRQLAHVLSVIVASICIYVGLVWLYRRFLACRMRVLNSKLPCNFTVRVQGISEKESRASLEEFFQVLLPNRVAAVNVVPLAPQARKHLSKLHSYENKLAELQSDIKHGDGPSLWICISDAKILFSHSILYLS